MLIALHKPYGVLSQFTAEVPGQRTLAECGLPPRVYAAGRLDQDSEGLLLLTDEKDLVDRFLNPRHGHPRTYHAQVEGSPTAADLEPFLQGGLMISGGHRCLPCRARLLHPEPAHSPRVPPIRERQQIPTRWIELTLTEGKNRQVRRMTAAIGFPTLRLIRVAIGSFPLPDLAPGEWRELTRQERFEALQSRPPRTSGDS